MRTVRDMNLSKLIADDVPLFLALLKDIFPKVTDPPKKVYKNVEDGSRALISKNLLVDWDSWMLKVVQLHLGGNNWPRRDLLNHFKGMRPLWCATASCWWGPRSVGAPNAPKINGQSRA